MTACAPALVTVTDCDRIPHFFHLKAHFTAVAFPFDHSSPNASRR